MTILGNYKENLDRTTTTANKSIGFDPNAIYLVYHYHLFYLLGAENHSVGQGGHRGAQRGDRPGREGAGGVQAGDY